MSYTFKLFIEKEKSKLSLRDGDKEVAAEEWPEDRDMGRRLFEAIKELLEKNHLQPEQVSDFVVDSEMPDNYTSMRIAETVKKVYAFGATFLR
jgi:tRNA A37 threonylcarbamoyladenosine modification protein TsaB